MTMLEEFCCSSRKERLLPSLLPLPLVLKPTRLIQRPICNYSRTPLSLSGILFSKWTPSPEKGGEGKWDFIFGCTNYLMGKRKAVQSLAQSHCSVCLSWSFPFFLNSRPCRRALNSWHIEQSVIILHVWIGACFRVMQMNVIVLFLFLFLFSETCIFSIHIWVSCMKTSPSTLRLIFSQESRYFQIESRKWLFSDPFWTGWFLLYDHSLVKHCLGEEFDF